MTETRTPDRAETSSATSRRAVLRGAAVATVGIAGAATGQSAAPAFAHGVASGDPLADRVIIWTRVTTGAATATLAWTVATDAAMTRVVKRGRIVVSAVTDYCAKIDVFGLSAGTTYYYQFTAGAVASPVGRTKTLPTGSVSRLKFALFSCANFEGGYFNVYAEAAKRDDLDAVLHVGDYIYEYRLGLQTPAQRLGLAPQPRLGQLQPMAEVVTLSDYRLRHATYKSDADLQELHRKNAWITIWDDHESANDSWTGGAENHQPATEGDWKARETAAIRAYYEWMPIREPWNRPRIDGDGNPQGMFRRFDFGDLVRLAMLDTRLEGRDRQLTAGPFVQTYAGARRDTLDGTAGTRARQMVGPVEQAWIADTLTGSPQTWQLIGNQVLLFLQITADFAGSPLLTDAQKAQISAAFDALGGPGTGALVGQLGAAGAPNPFNADSWTGYPAARATMLGTLARCRNPIVLTGDSHNAWTANLRVPAGGATVPVGVEFGGTSVTSGGLEQYFIGFPPALVSALLTGTQAKSPTDKLIYSDSEHRGFVLVDVTPTQVTGTHVFVSTVFSRAYTVTTQAFTVAAGAKQAVAA